MLASRTQTKQAVFVKTVSRPSHVNNKRQTQPYQSACAYLSSLNAIRKADGSRVCTTGRCLENWNFFINRQAMGVGACWD